MAKKQETIYGIHAVEAMLTQNPQYATELFLLTGRKDRRLQKLVDLATKQTVSIQFRNRDQLSKLAKSTAHQGVVMVARAPHAPVHDLNQLLEELTKPAFLLILDGVQDPHNLGACLRSADAAGVDAVIAPRDRAAGLTPTVRKVACGAADYVPFIAVSNLARTLKAVKEQGIWVYGLAGDSETRLSQVDMTQPSAIVLGAEEKGLRRLTREHCDQLVSIPMLGHVGSLNVSVAAGIALYEVTRQRL